MMALNIQEKILLILGLILLIIENKDHQRVINICYENLVSIDIKNKNMS